VSSPLARRGFQPLAPALWQALHVAERVLIDVRIIALVERASLILTRRCQGVTGRPIEGAGED